MGFLADKCTFRLLTRELIATCKPGSLHEIINFVAPPFLWIWWSWRVFPEGLTALGWPDVWQNLLFRAKRWPADNCLCFLFVERDHPSWPATQLTEETLFERDSQGKAEYHQVFYVNRKMGRARRNGGECMDALRWPLHRNFNFGVLFITFV